MSRIAFIVNACVITSAMMAVECDDDCGKRSNDKLQGNTHFFFSLAHGTHTFLVRM